MPHSDITLADVLVAYFLTRLPELVVFAARQAVRPEYDEGGVPGADDGAQEQPNSRPHRELVARLHDVIGRGRHL